MKIIFTFLLLCLLFILKSQNTKISIVAYDLSEDMSIVSTQNDEILILIYNCIDNTQQIKLDSIVRKDFDSICSSINLSVKTKKTDSLIIFLFELDSKYQSKKIIKSLENRWNNLNEISMFEEYRWYGNDFLGCVMIENNSKAVHVIKGYDKLDYFEYRVTYSR